MALPTVEDLRLYLRVETDAEDALLAALLDEALAAARAYVRRPVIARESTQIATRHRARDPLTGAWGDVLHVPAGPLGGTVVVTDGTGAEVDALTYTVDATAGVLAPVAPAAWGAGPYTVTADVGLSAHPDWDTDIEPVVAAAIRRWVAVEYQRRNPAASSESAGGGVATGYGRDAAAVVFADLAPYVRRRYV